jgi:hypothetical protein
VEGVCQIKDITLTWWSDASASFKIYTDLPTGTLALNRTLSLSVPSTGDRETQTFPLDTSGLLEGRLIKYRAEPTGELILFGGFIRFRRIGVYVNGALGDVWETQPLALGG